MSLIKKIKDYYKNGKKILFTTPSHSQGNFITPSAIDILGRKFYKCDFSEIEGFDNLREPRGIIKKLQTDFSKIYCSKATYMLTNGSTSGIIAAMLCCLKENDKVLIARNCHVSVYNGLVLTGAKPIWFLPEFDDEWGIYKGVTSAQIKTLIKNTDNIKALILTSPTYEGNFSEITEISQICKENKIKLIVDEAHGALLNFGEFKAKPAILCGADISIQSLHKTAGAPNPCALIHISQSSDLEPSALQHCLNIINTTSPSYPLLCAIESCIRYLDSKKGKSHIELLQKNIQKFKSDLPQNIKCYTGFNDLTKILLKIQDKNAECTASLLNKKYKIEEEFSNQHSMLFITGIGTDNNKLNKLLYALKKVALSKNIKQQSLKLNENFSIPKMIYTPREAFFRKKQLIPIQSAEGQICSEVIVTYPPGIPLLLPGEQITFENLFKIDKKNIEVCD